MFYLFACLPGAHGLRQAVQAGAPGGLRQLLLERGPHVQVCVAVLIEHLQSEQGCPDITMVNKAAHSTRVPGLPAHGSHEGAGRRIIGATRIERTGRCNSTAAHRGKHREVDTMP